MGVGGTLALLLLPGCASMLGTVRERAAVEFSCAEEEIEVEELPGSAFAARGCGRSASYACSRTYDGRSAYTGPVTCTREGSVQVPSPSSQPTPARTQVSASSEPPEHPDRAVVRHALGIVEALAQQCRRGPPATIHISVRFGSEGTVQSAAVLPPYERTTVGSCVVRLVRAARVPPFRAPFVEVAYPLALR